MQIRSTSLLLLSLAFSVSVQVARLEAKGPVYTKPNQAKKRDADFEIQGEYSGEVAVDGGKKVGGQVIALGNGKFALTVCLGGLPGDGWSGDKLPRMEATKKNNGSIEFQGEDGVGVLKDGVITVMHDGEALGELRKVSRKSQTLRKKAPKDAIVLFSGKGTDHWENAKMDDKLLTFAPKQPGKPGGTTSKQKFGDHAVHIEFRLPYMPEDRGQGRGNSGIYLQGRYEVQMLDSFGLEGEDNECGGIYKISKPKQNMCYPPLTWQTYDIDFTAARYDDAGEVVKNPHMTVKHNGVVIHQDLELPHKTTAAPNDPSAEDGPIFLQDHGNPVRYRNIWVVPKRQPTN